MFHVFTPGMPWPKITVHSQIRTINYDTASMREEITLTRGAAWGSLRGGGQDALSAAVRRKALRYFSSGAS